MSNKLSEILLESFHDLWKVARESLYTFYVNKGGRNSAKSTSISIIIILLIVSLPINALAIRKVANTLQESVFEQLKEATMFLGIEENFKFTIKPLKIVYIPRGNYILFRGADDPIKLKSIKTANFPIAIVWIEELSEFKTEEEVRTITDSILRASLPDKMRYRFFYSYNPPKRKANWVNKKYESQFIDKNTFVHHSDYRDNKYLAAETIEEINLLKERSIHKYNWIYLGMPLGGGIVPFDNLDFRPITDEEIKGFDNLRQGIDWGYSVDPMSFGRMHYDKTRQILYIFAEFYGVKVSNRALAQEIIKKEYIDTRIIADSAEPKSISEMKEHGVIRIKGAKKGAGSVEYGEKWLDDLESIVIDPIRCPNIAREFESIDYMVDKDGNTIPRLEETDNHSIDMVRYSMEDDMKKNRIRFLT